MRAHVHVYRVQVEAEVEIEEADSLEDAREKALAKVKDLSFREPDYRFIAIAWEA